MSDLGSRLKQANGQPRVWLVRPSKLIWLGILWVLALGVWKYGTPHLRVVYIWTGSADRPVFQQCDYWGFHSRRIFPLNGECPLVVFLRLPNEGR